MSETPVVASRTPWIVAACLAVVTALLVVGFVHVHGVSQDHARNPSGGGYDLTAAQQAAIQAAATEAANIVTFNRKTFSADFQRALNGATGSLKSDLSGEKATTLNTMTSGKFDLKGTVAATAYAGTSSDGKSLLVLVTVNGFKIADTSSQNQTSVQRLQLTMVKSGKAWLASALNAIGIQ